MPKRVLVNVKTTDEQREALFIAARHLNGGLSEFTRKAWVKLDPKLRKVFYDKPMR